MRDTTDGYSSMLKPSVHVPGGVGVFILHDVIEGTPLELFLADFQEELLEKNDVPKELQGYCLDQEGGKILCPKLFNRLDIGNYTNHSANPNMRYEEGKGFFATRVIKAGEELLADYRQLGEPEDSWDAYYTSEPSR